MRQKMADQWDQLVDENDVVLCPGDLSWAMNSDEANKIYSGLR